MTQKDLLNEAVAMINHPFNQSPNAMADMIARLSIKLEFQTARARIAEENESSMQDEINDLVAELRDANREIRNLEAKAYGDGY